MSTGTRALRLDLSPVDATGTGWHIEVGRGEADLGRQGVGPTAFAHRLGLFLGHPLSPALQGERIASATRILDELDDGRQWYSGTRAADPFGAAQWLVHAHDALRAAGWNGNALAASPRLAAIAALREGTGDLSLPPGLADVLHGLYAALSQRAPVVPLEIHLDSPRAAFPPLLRTLLAALEAHGCPVQGPVPMAPSAPADTDLGRLQRALMGSEPAELKGDGTLRMLRGDNPWEAAALATSLLGDDALWLLSGEDALLDRIRARFDRPRLGAGSASRWRPALQVLPLALTLQTGPQDPQTALELLTLPVCPVPHRIRRALVNALSDQPAVGSPRWIEALDENLAAYVERYPGTDIDALRNRIDTLFPSEPGPSMSAAGLALVVQEVATWARGRGAREDDGLLLAASSIATDMARSLALLPPDRLLTRPEIAQLHDLAVGEGVATDFEAEAGAPAVASVPDAVPVGCRDLVWFGLVAGNAELGRDIPWTRAERAELEAVGATLPGEGERRELEQDSWLGAVLKPSNSLTLVTWASAGAEPAEPHPLLDLWATRCVEDGLEAITHSAASLLSDPKAVSGQDIAPARDIHPRGTWRLDQGTASTDRLWSASSIGSLIKCPLGWTLRYPAKLRPGASEALPDRSSMAGTFAHALFALVLFEDEPGWFALTPELAQARILTLFDERVATEAAPLTLPANRAFSERLRRQLGRSIAALVRQLQAGQWTPEASEKELAELGGRFAGQPLIGSIDLLVRRDDGRRGVIDLKLGGQPYHAGSLREGRSIQLAVYAKAASEGSPPLPPVAYFILRDGELLSTNTGAFPDAKWIDGAGPDETHLLAERAWTWWARAVREGVVVARGDHIEDAIEGTDLSEAVGSDPPDHPWAAKSPSCDFCDARRLCRFTLQGGAR